MAETLNKELAEEKPTAAEPKSADKSDKDLSIPEKEKLLTIIYALLINPEHPIDLSAPYKAAEYIASIAHRAGLEISARTIYRRLKEILGTIAPRDKTSD